MTLKKHDLWLPALLFLLLFALAGPAVAVPLTTPYYSLDLPADWVVVDGPKKQNGASLALLGQKDHKTSVSIVVGPAKPGEAEKAAKAYAERLKGSKPFPRNGQIYFTFEQEGIKGYGILREDPVAQLLMILMVSGEDARADFVYKMRGPYKTLLPQRP